MTLPTKTNIVKAMTFPVVTYGYESWTIKKAEHPRTDVFKLGCWKRFLRVPWTERRLNQSILKEINPAYSLEGLMLKLKLQYFGHLMCRVNSLGKTLMLERLKAGEKGGGSVHGILQARIPEWVAKPSSRESCRPRDQTHISYVSCIGRRVFCH